MVEDTYVGALAAPEVGGGAILPPPVAEASGHTLRNILAGVGVLLLLVILLIGYAVAAGGATADRVRESHAALTRVNTNRSKGFQDRLASVTAGVDSSSSATFDPVKARGAVDLAASQMDGIRATDMADLGAIAAADSKVQERGILTAFSQAALDREHHRLDAYRRGLNAELAEIVTLKPQLAIMGDFLTTLEQLKSLTADMTASNIAAGERDYEKPSASLDKTLAEATASGETPPKMKEFLVIFRSELSHIKDILDAARDKNPPKAKAAVALLQKDIDALKSFDTASLQQQYTDLGSKLDDSVKALFSQAK